MNKYWYNQIQIILLNFFFIKLENFFFLLKNFFFFFKINNTNKINIYNFKLIFNGNYKNFNFYKSKKLFFSYFILIKNIFFFFFELYSVFYFKIKLNKHYKFTYLFIYTLYKKNFGDGFFYLRGLFLIFFIDACITDDEPLWEPLEWSLIQTWIFFIFIFAWIAENLITSRYGSYVGRDKRVWYAWYKTFWLIEFWYIISYGSAIIFAIVPFYYEVTYNIAFIYSWWNWYTKIFFFKFISIYSLILLISFFLLINIRFLNWKKLFFLILFINFFLCYLLYIHFIMSFFSYFTDSLWYQKNRIIDYIQLSHEPLKWGWGSSKRDHFTYHKTSTSFWFKNDGPFASSFLMIHLFLFLSLFFLYLYWLILLRKTYVLKEISFTFTTYCVSSLKQFFFFFLLIYLFIFLSFLINYWRFPIEFIWIINTNSWIIHFINIITDFFIIVFCYLLKHLKFYL